MNDDTLTRIDRLEKQILLSETYTVKAFWQSLNHAYRLTLPTRSLCCLICDYRDKRSGFSILTDSCQFGGGELERYQCPQCDCVFGPQKYLDLEENFVDLDYRLLYSRYSESDSSPNEIKTFHSLAPKHDGLYLDWGCGGEWSPTITKLRAHGWDVWGYDPSASQSNPYVVNSRDSISARFDGIFSNNVIEHFRNPVRQFCQFHKMLKEGGKMSHSSPCYEYCYAFTRFHTLFLIGRSADILAERTGFKITNRVKDGEYINIVFERI